MIIETSDLRLYTICPMMCLHRDSVPVNPLLVALKKALSYLYAFEMSNKNKVMPDSMMAKWDKIWRQHSTGLSEKEIAEQAVEGWLIIQKFMERVYNEDDRTPQVVGLSYKTLVGDTYLQTVFDVILSGKRGVVSLLEFSMATDTHNLRWQLETDIEAKAKLYLLKQSLGRSSCELVKFNLNKNLSKVSLRFSPELFYSTEYIIKGIMDNIKKELFYPALNCKCQHPEKCRT